VHGKIKEILLIRDLQPALNKNIMLAVRNFSSSHFYVAGMGTAEND